MKKYKFEIKSNATKLIEISDMYEVEADSLEEAKNIFKEAIGNCTESEYKTETAMNESEIRYSTEPHKILNENGEVVDELYILHEN